MGVTEISPDWQTLQGTTLEGGYELKDILAAAGDHAVLRVRVLGDYTLKATAAFYVLDAPVADEQLSIWQSIRFFDNRSAIAVPLGAGKLSLNGTTLAYVVYQTADETLDDAVQSLALTPEQALDAVRAIARGLGELHANGYVHGYLAPGEVRAVGDRVEISTEFIRQVNTQPVIEHNQTKYLAPECSGRNVTIAADIWCLGAVLFESLTRKTYEPTLRSEAASLPHPFGTLLEGCLEPNPEQRLKLPDFEPILRSKAPPPKPKPVPGPDAEPAKASAAAVSRSKSGGAVAERTEVPAPPIEEPSKVSEAQPGAAAEPPSEAKEPAGASVALPQRRSKAAESSLRPERAGSPETRKQEGIDERAGSTATRRGWIYAIAAFVVIFAILWFVRGRGRQSPVPASDVATGTASTKQPGSAWPTKTLTPDSKAPPTASEPTSASPAQQSMKTQTQGRTIWRVVLYTYRRQPDADKRAHEIAAKKPDLHPEVFAAGPSGPFLVVAGGGMTREAAIHMRSRAIREGMPHDSYIQNYDH